MICDFGGSVEILLNQDASSHAGTTIAAAAASGGAASRDGQGDFWQQLLEQYISPTDAVKLLSVSSSFGHMLKSVRITEPFTERSWDVKCLRELLQHKNAERGLRWLLSTSSNSTLLLQLSTPDVLLADPRPSPAVQKVLLTHGLKPSMGQLATAAQQGARLDCWLTQETVTDPLLRAARFSLSPPTRPVVPFSPSSIMRKAKAEVAAWVRLPDRVSAEQAVHVLLGVRGIGAFVTVKALLFDPACHQELGDGATARLLLTAVRQQCAVSDVAALPAARELRAADVKRLLHMALQLETSEPLIALVQLPAARGLSGADVAELLRAAVHRGSSSHMSALMQLPGKQDIPAAKVLELLLEAAQLRTSDHIAALVRLPAAQHLPHAEVVQLLDAAIQRRSHHQHFEALVQLQGMELHANEVLSLMQSAVQLENTMPHLEVLVRHPSARQLEAADVAGLMETAVRQPVIGHQLAALAQLPGAWHLQCATVSRLLEMAVQRASCPSTLSLLRLPAARHVEARVAVELMATAVRMRDSLTLGALVHMLPASRHVGRAAVLQLMHAALRCRRVGRGAVLNALMGLPPAQQLDQHDAINLFVAAVQQGWREELQELLQLPAVHRLGGPDLHNLLQVVMQQDDCSGLAAALQLTAMQHLQPGTVHELMHLAARSGKPDHLMLLLQLRPGRDLPPAEMFKLLREAELQRCRRAVG
jgi:hypothetical protein